MIIYKPLQCLEKKYAIKENEPVFRGSCGKIYSDKGDLIKIPYDFSRGNLLNSPGAQKRLYEEAKIHDFAVTLGIKLPKIYGLYAVEEANTKSQYPGLAMKGLGNLTMDKLDGSLKEKAEKQRKDEIAKAKDLGFIINDSREANAIWYPEEEQTYLLDCGLWGYKIEVL